MSYNPFVTREIREALPTLASAPDLDGAWLPTAIQGCREIVYVSQPSTLWELRCYTGIEEATGRSRARGADAIRLILVDRVSGRTYAKATRVHRTGTPGSLAARLAERVDDLREAARTSKRCACGAVLVERTNSKTGAKFWGCSAWRERHQPAQSPKPQEPTP